MRINKIHGFPIIIGVIIVVSLFLLSCTGERSNVPPNVVLIFVDDLNDWALHPPGHPKALVPNIDKLARQSVSFTNAHVAVPVCGPSRKCLFSGLYPQTINDYHFDPWAKSPVLENCVPLPRHFRDNGYQVYGAGKLLHEGEGGDFYTEYGYGIDYGPHPWRGVGPAEFTPHPAQFEQWKDLLPILDMHRDLNYGPLSNVPVVPPDPNGEYPGSTGWHYKNGEPFRYVSDEDRDPMPDEITAAFAMDVLSSEHEKPFFLAVGLLRTHSPLYAPKEYFDRFPMEEITLPPYLKYDREDCASVLRNRWEWGFTKFDALIDAGGEQALKEWVQAYLACSAFVDDQVGAILETLEKSPYKDNTIVILTSDNGYHIGEKDCIQKWHLWNESTRVPLLIQVPRAKTGGKTVLHPVSLVDLYPTLIDLCGLPSEPHIPCGGPALSGFSLMPFLEDPSTNSWDGPPVCLSAIRGPLAGNLPDTDEEPHFSVCSERYRYTLCANGEEELYNHQEDPNEWTNLAGQPEFSGIASQLRVEMKKILEKSGYSPAKPSSISP
jgi:arylsulfatase A-like enzyme